MANIDTDNFNIFSYYSTCMMIAGHGKNHHAHFGLTALLLYLPEVILNQPKSLKSTITLVMKTFDHAGQQENLLSPIPLNMTLSNPWIGLFSNEWLAIRNSHGLEFYMIMRYNNT